MSNKRKKTTSKEPRMLEIDFVRGVEGPSISLNGFRIAGNKPWGGGRIIWSGKASEADIKQALKL